MKRSRPPTSSPGTVPSARYRASGLAAFCLWGLLAACRTAPAIPPADLTQPGWHLEQGQVAWRLPAGDASLAGELTAAFHPDGSILLEFSKTPLALVVARVGPGYWELNLVAENRTFRGRGDPPPRSAWLVLARALTRRAIPGDWTWGVMEPGEWRLENARTGERLEGYLRP